MAEETVAVPEVAQEEVAPGAAEEAAAEPAVEVKDEEEAAAPASNNKRKFEDPDDDAEAQLKKRPSFAAGSTEAAEEVKVEPARASGFSDAPANGAGDPVAAAAAVAAQVAAQFAPPTQVQAGGTPTVTLNIPANMVGKVIGKGGETIKNLQNQSRTRIQIDHTTPGDTKVVTITSDNPDYLESARHLIEQVISDDNPQGEVTQVVECPPGIVGRVIGRGGETIRALQQASQAHIVVDQNFPEGVDRKVNINGRADAVTRAVKMVTELINGEPGSATAIIQKVNTMYGAGVSRTLDCPKEMVGRVIGKGGETIKSMQREFQSNIQIDQSQLPMKITISGQPAAVERTFQVVSEIVQGGNPYIGGTVGHAVAGAPPTSGPGGMGRGGGGGAYGGGGYGGGGFGGAPAYGAAAYGAPAYGAQPAYGAGYGSPAAGYAAAGYGQYAAQPVYGAAAGGYGGGAAAYGADPYAAQAQGGFGGAPAGGASTWQELADGEGRTYYYNTVTGVSQWEKPADM